MYDFKIGDKVCKNYQPGIIEDIVQVEGKTCLQLKGWLGYYVQDNFIPYEVSIKELESSIKRYENQIKIIKAFK
jgi:hypothetical protein